MTNDIRPNDICLSGCRPTPLASYLKALGILRLVAVQADPDVKGWWRAERFWLRTKLTPEEIAAFFLNDYAPSPIIAPWNGGSGFYPKDNQSGIAAIESGEAARFQNLKSAIFFGRDLLKQLGVTERPKDDAKQSMIAAVRAKAFDSLIDWIDAAVAITTDRLAFPPLLGTGGNDGRLDFTNNYFQRLSELFNPHTGEPKAPPALLSAAIFGSVAEGVADAAIGQFAPGDAGGPNSTSGYGGGATLNPWDFAFMLEGALVIAGGVVRRFASEDRSAASFPFTVKAAGAGFGAASQTEEGEARGEFWAPLWQAPSTIGEVRSLFREGRIAQTRRALRDGVDAALAIASVGSDRRIAAFQRYGFVQRQGLAYLAAPLGRRSVKPNPQSALATDLEMGGWLNDVRKAARNDRIPARFSAAVRMLEDSLFALVDAEIPVGVSKIQVDVASTVVIAVGRIARIIPSSRELRETLAPPPLLRQEWIHACGGDVEVRLAAALAGLHLQRPLNDELGDDYEARGKTGELPFRAHIAPLQSAKRRAAPRWDENGSSSATVWTEGRLVDSLVAVALRRSVEAVRENAGGGAFAGSRPHYASLEHVAAFLAGKTDDKRINDLALGFAWVSPKPPESASDVWRRKKGRYEAPLPLAYAAVKPIFAPQPEARARGAAEKEAPRAHAPIKFVPSVAPLLAAGRLNDAVDAAMQRARADGLATPFAGLKPAGVDARRFLAALMFPISNHALADCQSRAYPADTNEPDNNERTHDDAA